MISTCHFYKSLVSLINHDSKMDKESIKCVLYKESNVYIKEINNCYK